MNNKNFFFLSLIPALAYWYLEANYSVKIAVIGGLALATLEVSLEWLFTRHLHFISKFNFLLIAGLGGLSLLGEDGLWFKLQPFFTGLIMGTVFIYKVWRGKGVMEEMMEEMGPSKLPRPIVRRLELHMGILLMVYGIFMGTVALWGSTDQWLFFKTAGFYIVFFIFCVAEILWIRFESQSR